MRTSKNQRRAKQKLRRATRRTQFQTGLEPRPRWTVFKHIGPQVTELSSPNGEVLRDECDVFVNSRYKVAKYDDEHMIHLSIKRLDGQALQDWRELQRIKNELLGNEVEAVQLHPAESRLLDMCDQVHLWALKEGRFAFGFEERVVTEGTTLPGQTQRPFEQRPADLQRMKDFMAMQHLN